MFVSASNVSYRIGQKIENCRLMRGHTQIGLASQIGLTYQEVNSYESGYSAIPVEVLYIIAKALSSTVIDLLPESVVVREYKDEDEEILYLTKIYEDQKLGKIVPSLVRFVHISEKINQEEARLEVAKNLVKEGVSTDIISQATGLSTYEYNDTRKEVCTDSIYYRIGQRIREWRLIRRYTQKDLANKVDLTLKEIHDYERGYTAISFDKLYQIAEHLSVNIKVLLPKTNEDSELLTLLRKTEEQELVNGLVKFLSRSMKDSKEKVKKIEKIKVAKNLAKAGVSTDVILRASGLTADECEN
ncbi:WO male-killing family protein Wmk [Wolbachia endosymbiont of Drosophila pseudotakahashii]|uniref:WO male-killing family protein Wmk n=1 Tax=Wolbachia endosymbiont of Drosophila pseudotakahashii TaxID=375919 RepID=UPI00222FFAE4|nr:helix-turn-helix domain-containing protein [Wolbachia endosymbiont of Drosophila pseudotakahashii]MCX3065176.1 helix-turn-helix domain-containing protein [Wolbachia endosymbiont of Drosophila pseudotakahashii]UZE39093.1 helix-turn-helix domain-containing protein [Wolbachia endosymbiont of Drosophila pseudotakahashii]UZE39102.1 helix-turn-helix domain-containing protein [Wolbachia endosymbiont of Drosophila pseudotakahashii]